MKFTANINVMPRKELLDPQGKATILGLKNLGFDNVSDLRIGKRIFMEIEADTEEAARNEVEEACKKLLHNPIMESYEYELVGG